MQEEQRGVYAKNEKKIEDYHRVAMLAPECKHEIEKINEQMQKLKDESFKHAGDRSSISTTLKEIREK